jgi:hypothetical protein
VVYNNFGRSWWSKNNRKFCDVGDRSHTVVVKAVDVAWNYVEADFVVDTNPLSPGGPFRGRNEVVEDDSSRAQMSLLTKKAK